MRPLSLFFGSGIPGRGHQMNSAAHLSAGKSKARRKLTPRCHHFGILLGIVIAAVLLGQASLFKSLWKEASLEGHNLRATPWQPHNDLPSDQHSFWERLGEVHKMAKCLNKCPPPLKRPNVTEGGGAVCPVWFQYIHRDLAPWAKSGGGITPQVLEASRKAAAFRVVIARGRLFAVHYYKCPESRAVITLWSLAVLLRRYPGRVPDVDVAFDCTDHPQILKPSGQKQVLGELPLLLRYSGSDNHSDVAFPDWSFWGWPEARVLGWWAARGQVVGSVRKEGWAQRSPRAHWRGHMGEGAVERKGLVQCHGPLNNVQVEAMVRGEGERRMRCSDCCLLLGSVAVPGIQGVEGVELGEEAERAPKYDLTQLHEQTCGYRYKVFPPEPATWTPNLKYLLACGSVLLLPPLLHHDFFSRGLAAAEHVWPLQGGEALCSSIRFATEFGNTHPEDAQKIARTSQVFTRTELSMNHVYDYMLRLLQSYAKLQTFEPKIPKGARELCPEAILCLVEPSLKESLEQTPNYKGMSNPPTPCVVSENAEADLVTFEKRSAKARRQVAVCEKSGARYARHCHKVLS